MKRRSIVGCIILSIITCGLYYIYWQIVLTNELNRACRVNDTSGIMVLLLNIITCGLYSYYWSYRCGNKIDYLQNNPKGITNWLCLILHIFGYGFITCCVIQYQLNIEYDNRFPL